MDRFARQQMMVADLSSQALRGWEFSGLMNAAVQLTAEALDVELCKILKLETSGASLQLVAGVGWQEGLVGSATVRAGLESHAGYTLRVGEPVVVQELCSEGRFDPSPLLTDHGVVTGLSVPMSAGDFVFGVMGAHTKQCRDFSEQDIHFLEAVANILTIAVLRRQAVEALDRANKGLLETRRYLTSLMETSTDVIVSTSQEGDVVLCNKETNTLLGYRKEELIGHSMAVLYESEEESAELMRQMREGGGTVKGLETTLRAKDGSLIPVLTSASIFYDQEGQETGSVRFSRDLRERKCLEEELRLANEEVQKAHDSLERAKKTAIAAQKLAAMGRLTAGVSHEIQNPLNIITMRLQMMIGDPDTPPEFDRHLRVLLEHADRVAKITQDLLHLGRQRKPERRPFNLNEMIRRTLGLLEHDLRQRNILVVLGFAQDLPTVWGVEDKLTQVVFNLLTNARDVMPKGGQLGLSTAYVQTDDRRFVELRVEDTGEGITPEHLEKIFYPFFTTKPEGEGTGLGLYICRSIIEDHGGDMWAESDPGGGAAFIVRLPLRNRDA